jgi:hypothetical protein
MKEAVKKRKRTKCPGLYDLSQSRMPAKAEAQKINVIVIAIIIRKSRVSLLFLSILSIIKIFLYKKIEYSHLYNITQPKLKFKINKTVICEYVESELFNK